MNRRVKNRAKSPPTTDPAITSTEVFDACFDVVVVSESPVAVPVTDAVDETAAGAAAAVAVIVEDLIPTALELEGKVDASADVTEDADSNPVTVEVG